jgi:enamine deaminase RidA (YjgF/YER057c/UK114 family)
MMINSSQPRGSKEDSLSVYEKLESLKIELPALTKPVAAFVPFTRVGGLVFVSGHIAKKNGKPWEGQLGANLTVEQGKEAARGVAIDLIGALNGAIGDLNRIRQIVKIQVLVNSTPAFTEQHLVANGASELLMQVFGDAGAHARAAFGVAQVPFGACMEVDLIAEVDDK